MPPDRDLRLALWNIRQGAGPRTPAIAEALLATEADVLVLCEVRRGASAQLRGLLERSGYALVAAGWDAGTPAVANCVAVFARLRVRLPRTPAVATCDRLVHCLLPGAVHLLAAHLPIGRPELERPYWDGLMAFAAATAGRRALVLGDLNALLTTLDSDRDDLRGVAHARELAVLSSAGWRDPWRERNPQARDCTWISPGRPGVPGAGYRVDCALVSRSLRGRVRACAYDHAVRAPGVSDHSLLTLDLAPMHTTVDQID